MRLTQAIRYHATCPGHQNIVGRHHLYRWSQAFSSASSPRLAQVKEGDPRMSIHLMELMSFQRLALLLISLIHTTIAPVNQVRVPLISPLLRDQLFPPSTSKYAPPPPTQDAVHLSQAHLKMHGLWPKIEEKKISKPVEPAIQFKLPVLQGDTISHHFHAMAQQSAEPFLTLATEFVSAQFDSMPYKGIWLNHPGWTYYYPDGSFECIDYPPQEDEVLVFDVETLPYVGGDYPIMAVAVGRKGWYGWVSPWLSGTDESPQHMIPFSPLGSKSHTKTGLLEPMDSKPRLIIGHNVLFDRARVSTEYTLQRPVTRWIDTMSLHIATSGISSPQRIEWMRHRKRQSKEDSYKLAQADDVDLSHENEDHYPSTTSRSPKVSRDWKEVSSMASLADVARLHLGRPIDKSMRNALIDPITTINTIRESFQDFMNYCAVDVLTTLQVYQIVLPKFLKQCPHPASFSGIITMSQPVLPVDYHWPKYLKDAEDTYQETLLTTKSALAKLAEEARCLHDKRDPQTGEYLWKSDPWLSQLDWSPKRARRLEKSVKLKKSLLKRDKINANRVDPSNAVPLWYAQITSSSDRAEVLVDNPLVAILLQITWRGHHLVYTKSHGWLFAVAKSLSTDEPFVPEIGETFVSPYDLTNGKDHAAANMSEFNLYTLPNGGKKNKVRTLFQASMAKLVSSGHLSSPHPEFSIVMASLKDTDSQAYVNLTALLSKLASEALQTQALSSNIKDDPWLSQLDWTATRKSTHETTENTSSPPSVEELELKLDDIGTKLDLVWPKWYHDLDVVGEGIDISIKKRSAPLLLKVRWKGHPLFYSKAHGWMYQTTLSKDGSRGLTFEHPADMHLLEIGDVMFQKVPHPDGIGKNVGQPLSKTFLKAFEDGFLSSQYPLAASVLELNASCSYWTSSRERITEQLVVWDGDAKTESPLITGSIDSEGLILPQVVPMGTVTRRSVEKTWLTASNAKKNRVGSELKSMVKAPPGYVMVGADVDSEELWICSVMGDAQFGFHGATAVGWMTLEGTKNAGTDLHSNSANILGISRDDAKVFNYSRIYGAGVKHATELLVKSNPNLSLMEAGELAKKLYASTKGISEKWSFGRTFWHGGTESFIFNKLEEIALAPHPKTPTLGCGITAALTKEFLNDQGHFNNFMTSRVNWVVQSSGVDYLHLLLVSMEYLTRRFSIDARYMISVHDEIRYLVSERDQYRAAMALQISNLWVRSLFSYRLHMESLPQSCAFFSAVDIDNCFRKEVNMACVTPSNPEPIPFGNSLDISACLEATQDGSLFADGRSMGNDATLGDLVLKRELTPDEICSGGHRESNLAFLKAQISQDEAYIRSLWKSIKFDMKLKTEAVRRDLDQLNRGSILPDSIENVKKPKPLTSASLHEYLRSIESDLMAH